MSIESGGTNIEKSPARKVAEDLVAKFNANPSGPFQGANEGLLESELESLLVAPAAQAAGVDSAEVMAQLEVIADSFTFDRGRISHLKLRG